MGANLWKAVLIAILFAGLPLVYFRVPTGDRSFALVVYAGFAAIVSAIILFRPVLYCPGCGRATGYFDKYTEVVDRLQGGHYRRVFCHHCHCIIDRLTREVVVRMSREDGQTLMRIRNAVRTGVTVIALGCFLVLVCLVLGGLMIHGLTKGVVIRDRASHVLAGCGVGFAAGILLVVTGWWRMRSALGDARSRGGHDDRRGPIRW